MPATHTVSDLVTRAAVRDPDRAALLSGGAVVTWAELDDLVDRAAAALRGLGLVPEDRVVLQLGNSVDFPVLYCGALRAGLVAVPANSGYTGAELTHLLTDSGAPAAGHVLGARHLGRARAAARPAGAPGGGGAVRPRGHPRPAGAARRRGPGPGRPARAGLPGGPRGARLHQRHQRPAARRDALAPGAAGQPRPVRGAAAAAGDRRRRAAAGHPDVPRVRAEPRFRACSPTPARPACWSSTSTRPRPWS